MVGAAVLLAIISTVSLVTWKSERDDRARLHPLVEAMDLFVVPAGAMPSIPESRTVVPLRLVRGWSDPASIDDACRNWSNSFRLWVGEEQALGSVTGEFVPGQSCSYEGNKGGYRASLVVNVYGSEPTQALLTLSG